MTGRILNRIKELTSATEPQDELKEVKLSARDVIYQVIEKTRQHLNDLYPPADAEESRAHILTRLRGLSDRYSAEQFGKMHRIIGDEFDTARTFDEQENKARHLLHGTRQLRDGGKLHPEQAQFLEDLISSYHGFVCQQLGKKNTIEVPPPPGERSPLTSVSKRK